MNEPVSFERFVADQFTSVDRVAPPSHSVDDVLTEARRMRPLPRWLALIKEPPMRLSSRVAVGSSTARLMAILLATLLLAVTATGAVVAGATLLAQTGSGPIVVAQDGSGRFRTIGEAVALAQEDDTVLIRPGHYVESVDVAKDITISGEGDRAGVIVEATLSPYPGEPEFILNWAFVFRDSAATLSNVTVIGQETGDAIWVGVGAAPVLEAITIDLVGTFTGDHVPIWWGGQGGVLRDSTVSGFMGVASGSPLIEGNTLTGCLVVVEEADAPVIKGNTIRDCPYGYLINVEAGTATIEGNDLGDFSGTGIRIVDQPVGLIVRENAIHDLGTGISIETGTPDVAIEGNMIIDNVTGVVVSGVGTAPAMSDNTYCGNQTHLRVPDGSTLSLDGDEVCEPGTSAAP